VEPIKYETEVGNPYVMFDGRILNMDAVTESRLLKNIRAHRVLGGICADVTHCQSGLWNCVDCECFVPEAEQLFYFKDQVTSWNKKANVFHTDKQIADNCIDIAKGFMKIMEKLEDKCYNGK
jgi:hypothetical protein